MGFVARLSDCGILTRTKFSEASKESSGNAVKVPGARLFAGKRFCCLDSENDEHSNLLPLPHRGSPRRNGLYRMPGRGRVRARKGLFRRSTGCSRSCRLPSTPGSTRIPIGRRLGCRRTCIRCAQCTCSEGVRESGGIQACVQDTSISSRWNAGTWAAVVRNADGSLKHACKIQCPNIRYRLIACRSVSASLSCIRPEWIFASTHFPAPRGKILLASSGD